MNGAPASDGRDDFAASSLEEMTAALTATVETPVGSDALAGYAAFCETAHFAPPQSVPWVRHWINQTAPDALIATLRHRERPVLALALEVGRTGPFGVATFVGGTHANGNFPASDPRWVDAAAMPTTLRPLFRAIARARPDLDVVALERLQPDCDGATNPMLVLPGQPSPNVALAASLQGGFDAVLDRVNGKRKCKKHRSQARKFEALGGCRRLRATTPGDVEAFLDAFFAMKDARFRRMGIADVFAAPDIRRFFKALFTGALDEPEPSFALHALEVQGRLRAVTGSSRSARRLICDFAGISEDEITPVAPGDFLFFENIRDACGQGFDTYDFSVGDEPYKRQWCDTETWQTDALVPLTAKGHLLAYALRRTARLKYLIKRNPAMWKLARKLRRGSNVRRADEMADNA